MAPQFSIQMRGLESRSRDLPGSPRDRSPEWNFSSEAKSPEQGVTQSDDDLEDVQSAAVRNFLKSSKPHRSAPVSDTNGDSTKRHSTGRTGPSGLGIFSARVQHSSSPRDITPTDSPRTTSSTAQVISHSHTALNRTFSYDSEPLLRNSFFASNLPSIRTRSKTLLSLHGKHRAVDGYNMVPNIRPLETLHNSLNLNQITDFFDNIIKADLVGCYSEPIRLSALSNSCSTNQRFSICSMDGLGNQHNEGAISASDTLSMVSDAGNKDQRKPLKQQDSLCFYDEEYFPHIKFF